MNLPNWAKLSLGLALVVITWIMNEMASGQLVLPSVVMTVLTVAKTVIAMLTDGVPTASAKLRAARAASRVSGLLVVLGAIDLVACNGCSGTAGQVATVVIPPVVDVAGCVIKVVSVDLAQGETLDQAFADAESQCLLGHAPSAAERSANDPTVAKIWGSVIAADEARGLHLPDGGTP